MNKVGVVELLKDSIAIADCPQFRRLDMRYVVAYISIFGIVVN